MDAFYDLEAASHALQIQSEARRIDSKTIQDALPHLADIEARSLTDAYNIVEVGAARKSWKLCTFEEGDEVATEVVFTIQGVLTKANLVPKHVREPNQIIRLSQYAEICGLGSTLFEDSMANAKTVHDRFAQHFSGTAVAKWTPVLGPTGSVYSASNRLFTMKADAPTEQGTDFEPGVDPTGALESLRTSDLFHGPENVVKYFRKALDQETGRNKYLPSYPGAFRVGDLVEMQVSFVAIMTSQNQVKVTSRLHALTLLDASFTKASIIPLRPSNLLIID
ncbi:hypothetical protein DFH06DRAFT_1334347 [Mycena polygramma]|nr:hypothetical protein DFH06DRAFT_1334347 [Mycena polygramma]